MLRTHRAALGLLVAATAARCQTPAPSTPAAKTQATAPATGRPTPEEAKAFVAEVNANLKRLLSTWERAEWVKATYITHDTEILAAHFHEQVLAYTPTAIAAAQRFEGLELDPATARALKLLAVSSTLPAPTDTDRRKRLARLSSELRSMYSKGKYCKNGDCRSLGELSAVIARADDYDAMLEAWSSQKASSRRWGWTRCRRRSGSARCSPSPRDRDVVCHASAWDVSYENDLRIKMCIKVDGFSGRVPPDEYNSAWWALREKYQGVAAPTPRDETHFDPGAKYHIPSNVPYTRYFLARVLQFQFHRALCRVAGHEGPLHECSIHGSKAAGDKLRAMLQLGASRPWPDALEALTGEREMDASALIDYFAPLTAWLEKQNAGRACGW